MHVSYLNQSKDIKEWLQKNVRELFGVMEMLLILILVVVKTHQTVYFEKSELCHVNYTSVQETLIAAIDLNNKTLKPFQ